MTDNFSLLDEPRRPWIDPEGLKQKFLALSAEVHPDRVHNAPPAERRTADSRYSELNSAYNSLRDPKERLRHLLELETGAKPADIQSVPPGITGLFFEVGRVCQESDQFLKEKAAASSPLLKVALFERGQDWVEKLQGLQQTLNSKRADLFRELEEMNAFWNPTSPLSRPLERLELIYKLLGYYGRWSDQMQERIVQLSF